VNKTIKSESMNMTTERWNVSNKRKPVTMYEQFKVGASLHQTNLDVCIGLKQLTDLVVGSVQSSNKGPQL
jgi:hypothetical protein